MHKFSYIEDFTSIQELQAGATKLLERAGKRGAYYRVLKNNRPIGVLLPNEAWEDFLEDMEALTSVTYQRSIAIARKQKSIPIAKVKKMLGL